MFVNMTLTQFAIYVMLYMLRKEPTRIVGLQVAMPQLYIISLHEGVGFSIHSLNRIGSAAVYFITWTTRQALALPA